MLRWEIGSGHLFIRQGDITTLSLDAIVNAANSRLAGGGGVDGAIHRAAGLTKLQQVCRSMVAVAGELPAGDATITPGFDLPARYIIHTVGPIWRGGSENESLLLRSAYVKSLLLAQENNIQTIGFPAISCGTYGYPMAEAARIGLAALKEGVEAGLVAEAGMVLHGAESYTVWSEIAQEIL